MPKTTLLVYTRVYNQHASDIGAVSTGTWESPRGVDSSASGGKWKIFLSEEGGQNSIWAWVVLLPPLLLVWLESGGMSSSFQTDKHKPRIPFKILSNEMNLNKNCVTRRVFIKRVRRCWLLGPNFQQRTGNSLIEKRIVLLLRRNTHRQRPQQCEISLVQLKMARSVHCASSYTVICKIKGSLIKKGVLRYWQYFKNQFVAPLPTIAWYKKPQLELFALLAI